MNNAEIISQLEKAAQLNGEAQDAYDFHAYGNAAILRNESSAILLPLFREHAWLRENFPHHWVFLSRADADNQFSAADVQKARSLLR